MKIKWICFFVVFALFTVYGCKTDRSNETSDSTPISTETEQHKQIPSYARFGFESGKIEMEMTTLGMQQTMTIYFQDWGNIARTVIMMNMAGMKQEISTLTKNGWIYTWDNKNRIGQKIPVHADEANQLNYLTLKDADEEFIKKYNLQYKGEQEIQGKTCQIFVLKPQQNVELKVAVWQGIPMETEVTANGITTKITVKKLELDVALDAQLFEVPAGVTFQEMNVPVQKSP